MSMVFITKLSILGLLFLTAPLDANDFAPVIPENYNLEKSIQIQENPQRFALVMLEDAEYVDYSGEGYRKLFIVEKRETAETEWEILAQSNEIVLCYFCGGVLGDPFQNIEFTEAKLFVYHYGGSSLRWSKAIIIESIRGKYYVTNYTKSTASIHTMEENSTHENFITRMRTITTIKSDSKPVIERIRVPDSRPINIEKFRY